jgi:ribosome-binding factor A
MSSARMGRIEEEMKKALSDIIRNQVNDPRIYEFLSVISVEVTKDLKYAKAYISIYGDDEKRQDSIKGLNNASGFIRREIGRRLQLRNTPIFTFILDTTIEYGVNISKLIEDVKVKDNIKVKDDESAD